MQDERSPDVGVFESHSEYHELKAARKLFWRVVGMYRNARAMSPLVAQSYDEFKPNRKYGPEAICYGADVENCTTAALKGDRYLIDQWNKMVFDEENVPNATAIIGRCGRLYGLRKLNPRDYFTHMKRGRKRGWASG